MEFFGIIATVFFYKLFENLKNVPILKKVPTIIFTSVILILILKYFSISYQTYNKSAGILTFLLAPATIALAFPLYKNLDILNKNKRAIYFGLILGAGVAILSTWAVGKILHLDAAIILSMLPKSVTTPIAVAISKNINGIPELTACLVIITGLMGGLFGHRLLRAFKIKNSTAIGLSMGASCHILGTIRCKEKGNDKQVAISTLALILTGIITAIITQLLFIHIR